MNRMAFHCSILCLEETGTHRHQVHYHSKCFNSILKMCPDEIFAQWKKKTAGNKEYQPFSVPLIFLCLKETDIVFNVYSPPPPKKNNFVSAISTTVHRKQFIPFCIENAKCAIFADLFHNDICEINNTFLLYMLTKGNVSCTAFKALKW